MPLLPIELCPHCGDYVLRGQTFKEYAKQHGCTFSTQECPSKDHCTSMRDGSIPYKSNTILNPFTNA